MSDISKTIDIHPCVWCNTIPKPVYGKSSEGDSSNNRALVCGCKKKWIKYVTVDSRITEEEADAILYRRWNEVMPFINK